MDNPFWYKIPDEQIYQAIRRFGYLTYREESGKLIPEQLVPEDDPSFSGQYIKSDDINAIQIRFNKHGFGQNQ